MSGMAVGYGGALDELLAALPLDSTGHVMDCGYDDNDRRCGCYNLPAELKAILARHVTAALTEAADAIEAVNTPKYMGPKRDAYDDAARIVRAQIPPPT